MRNALIVAVATLALQEIPAGVPGTQLRELVVTVTDRSGQTVRDLNAEDFVLTVNSVPREIATFERDSDLPISLGILIDRSGSMSSSDYGVSTLAAARGAARILIDQARSADEFLLMYFSNGLDVRQEFTQSRGEIRSLLAEMRDSMGGTDLFGALNQALSETRKAHNRGRALVVITDAQISSDVDLTAIAGELSLTELEVYTVGLHITATGTAAAVLGDALDSVETLAAGSKGYTRVFKVHSPGFVGELTAYVDEIQSQVRGHYTVGYYPEADRANGLYPVRLRTRDSRYQIRVRQVEPPGLQ